MLAVVLAQSSLIRAVIVVEQVKNVRPSRWMFTFPLALMMG